MNKTSRAANAKRTASRIWTWLESKVTRRSERQAEQYQKTNRRLTVRVGCDDGGRHTVEVETLARALGLDEVDKALLRYLFKRNVDAEPPAS